MPQAPRLDTKKLREAEIGEFPMTSILPKWRFAETLIQKYAVYEASMR